MHNLSFYSTYHFILFSTEVYQLLLAARGSTSTATMIIIEGVILGIFTHQNIAPMG